MTIRQGWDIYQLCELTLFLAAFPVVIYRVWRWSTNRPSRSLLAGAVFATSLWIWTYFDTEFGWKILTPQLKSFQLCGGTAILASSALVAFTANACNIGSKRQDRLVYSSAVITTGVIAVLAFTTPEALGDASYYAFLTEPHPALPAPLHIGIVSGHAYVFGASLLVATQGIKHLDATPAGQGIGMLGLACLLLLVTVFTRYIVGETYQWHGHVPPFWCGLVIQTIFGATAAIIALTAFAWPPAVLWRKAYAELRTLNVLHRDLIAMFPGLEPPISREDRLTDRVNDRISHIQDGLFLTAQQRETPLAPHHQDDDNVSQRASEVAKWLTHQTATEHKKLCLSTPPSTSDKQWILTIANCYRHEVADQSSTDAGPSGDTPSTSHKRSTISATTRRLSGDNA
ncbi:hypothetical protein [Mycobacteroides abscessus]|uniref:hypothetical protein n=1 Tax=Mycobacteroides abscessus TaxID=36809 RepID=UPI0009D07DE5|nr:hypothetical protein [Mycobacteroides abscessus]SKF70617.1 Uncharacterised protein [Mycobacteroides abscessus subsp. bolletii]SKF73424.1 Uncharacterised protein [Mycobacteroides abscessus subsp. bolletii]SKH74419.1 Uncharacterised protein [Mycobacteroides abscessus subsp. bolletii]SKH93564.1 Uncharacterised protein [Mycobacteroides abscessus subsp. bolletii]SKH97837.1 Uncharacterised protein [Mycobacteroides abscessus subsp. bolletii]